MLFYANRYWISTDAYARCLAIGRAHKILDHSRNALALFSKALTLAQSATDPADSAAAEKPLRLGVSPDHVTFLREHLQGLVSQQRALVELQTLTSDQSTGKGKSYAPPMVERLDEYPAGSVDLTNLVTYPPKFQPIPVKPIFLDLAWNYIEYPGQARKVANGAKESGTTEAKAEGKKETRKGWFGFGR